MRVTGVSMVCGNFSWSYLMCCIVSGVLLGMGACRDACRRVSSAPLSRLSWGVGDIVSLSPVRDCSFGGEQLFFFAR